MVVETVQAARAARLLSNVVSAHRVPNRQLDLLEQPVDGCRVYFGDKSAMVITNKQVADLLVLCNPRSLKEFQAFRSEYG